MNTFLVSGSLEDWRPRAQLSWCQHLISFLVLVLMISETLYWTELPSLSFRRWSLQGSLAMGTFLPNLFCLGSLITGDWSLYPCPAQLIHLAQLRKGLFQDHSSKWCFRECNAGVNHWIQSCLSGTQDWKGDIDCTCARLNSVILDLVNDSEEDKGSRMLGSNWRTRMMFRDIDLCRRTLKQHKYRYHAYACLSSCWGQWHLH